MALRFSESSSSSRMRLVMVERTCREPDAHHNIARTSARHASRAGSGFRCSPKWHGRQYVIRFPRANGIAAPVKRDDVMDLQPASAAAPTAAPAVPVEHYEAHALPSTTVQPVMVPAHATPRYAPVPVEGARRRTPSATARMPAAAASSRARRRLPPCVAFASLALPAGSIMVRASPIAGREEETPPRHHGALRHGPPERLDIGAAVLEPHAAELEPRQRDPRHLQCIA